MASANFPHRQLSLVPLGAGDLIDRAVRFYRANFFTYVLIAGPPVVIGTVLSVGWLYLARALFFRGGYDPLESGVYAIFVFLGGSLIWFAETVATLCVMGGASLNFVRHLLFGEQISFRDTYRYAWSRAAALIVISAFVILVLSIISIVVFYLGFFVGLLVIFGIGLVFSQIPILAILFGVVAALVDIAAIYWLYCLIASRFAYVPQVMMVEERGAFEAIGRSMSLASGNAKRFAALFAFTIVATYSALAILYVPLAWYAWYEGVSSFGLSDAVTPPWYEIASQLIWQLSIILLIPVWMIGLCLLYVDERVRHEGYDLELMAARRLGEIPDVPDTYINPLQPALGARSVNLPGQSSRSASSGISVLGLK